MRFYYFIDSLVVYKSRRIYSRLFILLFYVFTRHDFFSLVGRKNFTVKNLYGCGRIFLSNANNRLSIKFSTCNYTTKIANEDKYGVVVVSVINLMVLIYLFLTLYCCIVFFFFVVHADFFL